MSFIFVEISVSSFQTGPVQIEQRFPQRPDNTTNKAKLGKTKFVRTDRAVYFPGGVIRASAYFLDAAAPDNVTFRLKVRSAS